MIEIISTILIIASLIMILLHSAGDENCCSKIGYSLIASISLLTIIGIGSHLCVEYPDDPFGTMVLEMPLPFSLLLLWVTLDVSVLDPYLGDSPKANKIRLIVGIVFILLFLVILNGI